MSSIRPVVRGMGCWTDDSCSIKVNLSSCLYCEKAFSTSVLARWPTSCFRLRSKHINTAGMCGHRVPVWKRSLEPWVTLLTDLTWYWRGCECVCRRGRERYNYLLVLFFLSFFLSAVLPQFKWQATASVSNHSQPIDYLCTSLKRNTQDSWTTIEILSILNKINYYNKKEINTSFKSPEKNHGFQKILSRTTFITIQNVWAANDRVRIVLELNMKYINATLKTGVFFAENSDLHYRNKLHLKIYSKRKALF